MEEFLLGTLLSGKKLDIVDQQCVDRAVLLLEIVDRVVLQRLDHLCNEALGVEVDHTCPGVAVDDQVADSMHQVGLAETDPAVDEQGVIGLARIFRDLQRGGAGQLV